MKYLLITSVFFSCCGCSLPWLAEEIQVAEKVIEVLEESPSPSV